MRLAVIETASMVGERAGANRQTGRKVRSREIGRASLMKLYRVHARCGGWQLSDMREGEGEAEGERDRSMRCLHYVGV